MWHDKDIREMAAQIERLDPENDESEIFALTMRMRAMQQSRNVLHGVNDQVRAADHSRDRAGLALARYELTTSWLLREAVSWGLAGIVVAIVWGPQLWLVISLALLVVVSTAVGVYRADATDKLAGDLSEAENALADALYRLDSVLRRVDHGVPVISVDDD